jgi:hypothetical protein
MFINFANYYVLIPVLILTVILLVMGFKTKRSIYTYNFIIIYGISNYTFFNEKSLLKYMV